MCMMVHSESRAVCNASKPSLEAKQLPNHSSAISGGTVPLLYELTEMFGLDGGVISWPSTIRNSTERFLVILLSGMVEGAVIGGRWGAKWLTVSL